MSLYNSLSHIIYALDAMQHARQNVFMLFGIWHAYMYGHVAIWDCFRAHFLADAFFALFPTTTLLRKPSLFKSSIFFTWLRVSYPKFREDLLATLEQLKKEYLDLDKANPRQEHEIVGARSRFIHCLNLYTLLEFAIPVLQDYGASIKLNSLELFLSCFNKLLLLFIMIQSAGSNMYIRCMVLFLGHLKHWREKKVCCLFRSQPLQLPIMDVIKYNLTALSEESGELALGLLARSLNTQNRCEVKNVNEQWRRVRLLHEARLLDDQKPSPNAYQRKFRYVGMTLFLDFSKFSCCYFILLTSSYHSIPHLANCS